VNWNWSARGALHRVDSTKGSLRHPVFLLARRDKKPGGVHRNCQMAEWRNGGNIE
jgi:hypothetical protein